MRLCQQTKILSGHKEWVFVLDQTETRFGSFAVFQTNADIETAFNKRRRKRSGKEAKISHGTTLGRRIQNIDLQFSQCCLQSSHRRYCLQWYIVWKMMSFIWSILKKCQLLCWKLVILVVIHNIIVTAKLTKLTGHCFFLIQTERLLPSVLTTRWHQTHDRLQTNQCHSPFSCWRQDVPMSCKTWCFPKLQFETKTTASNESHVSRK